MLRLTLKHVTKYFKNSENKICTKDHTQKFIDTSTTKMDIQRIVWVDLELTGLDIENDYILEVACLVTDSKLKIVAEAPNLILHQPKEVLDNMNEWCLNQHSKTGLIDASLKSMLTVKEAEKTLVNFVSQHIGQGVSPLAGSSVYMDRIFIKKYMPTFDSYLHYRIIDVSSIKELCKRWNPELDKMAPKKTFTHRALDDIKESIQELEFYRMNFFNIK